MGGDGRIRDSEHSEFPFSDQTGRLPTQRSDVPLVRIGIDDRVRLLPPSATAVAAVATRAEILSGFRREGKRPIVARRAPAGTIALNTAAATPTTAGARRATIKALDVLAELTQHTSPSGLPRWFSGFCTRAPHDAEDLGK